MIELLYRSLSTVGLDRIIWRLDASRLRILCYHGVCEDHLKNEPWVPPYFVTKTAFESQLQFLRDNAHVLPLAEAADRLAEGSLPLRAVSITFDDGYANNLRLALPLLSKYRLPATIFLTSAYVESGDFHPFLKVKLIQLRGNGAKLPEYQSTPIDNLVREADVHWPVVRDQLSKEQQDTLRPMTVEELRAADSRFLDFGAHSHTHCILKNESGERRESEIQTSLRKVGEWTGRQARLFSYPNGEPGDFGDIDKRALRAAGVRVAVTGIGGANGRSADPLALKRYPMTIQHTFARFRAEICGLRSALLAVGGKRSS